MTSSRDRRIAKELADIQADRDNSGVFAVPADGVNLSHLKGTIPAPPETPYAGGTFDIDIQIPDSYPFKSPLMRFDTKIWHPNVSSQTVRFHNARILGKKKKKKKNKKDRLTSCIQGAICLDTLGNNWSPVQTIKTALLSLRMLLESPNPKDPQDAQVATMLLERPEQFAAVAQEWAVRYAGAPKQDLNLDKWKNQNSTEAASKNGDTTRYQGYNKDLVDRFVNMGFDIDAVVEAFTYVGIDHNGGQDYELEEAYMGDITARLLGEQ
ncbi:hypothetical protein L249_1901 [Ophiocordyceps polyrhachis-furcata BCC 54312]|uniref:UBC core domain-containing protein n=1 Tax=Ophiocordyceps polyrhachis-furcata BCC 54312 TaxID=1330021 RepID=A0A367LP79_9HYPO|nr:hypothetical protein L249_1901 [Ophiocordyceps polyrhachis-furcata BCC 54312]